MPTTLSRRQFAARLGASVAAAAVARTSLSRPLLVITCVNPRHDAGAAVKCRLSAASATAARARVLHDADFNACNTFENPDLIAPRTHPIAAAGRRVEFDMPPMSIVTGLVDLSSDGG